MELRRQHQREMGHPRGIEIGFKGQINALALYLLKQCGTLVIYPFVGDMDGDARLLGKCEGLFPRFFPSEDSVTDMCGIDRTIRSRELTQSHQLAEICVGTRLVIKPQAEATSTSLQPLAGCFHHGSQFFVSGWSRIPPHHPQTNRTVRHLWINVGGSIAGKDAQIIFSGGPIEVKFRVANRKLGITPHLLRFLRWERCPAKPIRCGKLGGHTLTNSTQPISTAQQRNLRMNMDINETGAYNLSYRIDTPVCLCRI